MLIYETEKKENILHVQTADDISVIVIQMIDILCFGWGYSDIKGHKL